MVSRVFVIFIALFWIAGSAAAQELSVDPDYQACVERIEQDPATGRYEALRWISDGGGDPAVYCAAVADLAMDLPRLAGGRLQTLAEKNRTLDPYLSARLYVQAAQAWAAGNETDLALAAINEADRMAPGALEVKLLSAPVYAELGRWGLVKRNLDEAEQIEPLTAPALVLRSRARLQLLDQEGAASDLQQALNLQPDNIDGLILRGELAQSGIVIDSVSRQ